MQEGPGAGEALGGQPIERRHGACGLHHLGEVAAAMKRHVAAGGEHRARAVSERAAKGLHADIVAHHQAFEPDQITNHLAHYNGRDARRSPLVVAGQQHMGGHGERGVAQRLERAEIDGSELALGHVDARQREMAVGLGAAVARHMLDHRQHAAGERPIHHRAPERGDHVRVGREGAVADDLVRSLLRHVEHRGAVHIDAEQGELLRDQPRAGEGRVLAKLGVGLIHDAIAARRRHVAPMRRTEPLHAAALLIDQDEHVLARDRVLERGDERAKLVRALAIPRKDDQSAGTVLGEERAFGVAERGARAARDEGFEVHDAA